MYDTNTLNDMLVSELREVADKLNVPNFIGLEKQDLVSSILEKQTAIPDAKIISENKTEEMDAAPKRRGRPKVAKADEPIAEVTETEVVVEKRPIQTPTENFAKKKKILIYLARSRNLFQLAPL